MSDPFSVPPPENDDALPDAPEELSAFDAQEPMASLSLGNDTDTIKKINRRTSPLTKVLALVIIVGVIGLGAWAYVTDQAHGSRMEVFEPIAQMDDESQRNAALREVLQNAQFDDVKQRALKNLGHFRDAQAVPLIIPHLEHRGQVRRDAAWALGMIGTPAADAAKPKLLEVLPNTDHVDRPRVVWTLAVLRAQDQAAIDALIAEFSEGNVQEFEDFEARIITEVLGLSRLSSPELTEHESEAVRLLTANALAEVGDQQVVGPLSRILTNELGRDSNDQHMEVIRAAVGGLGRTGSREAARPLFQTLQQHAGLKDMILDALQRSTAAPDIAILLPETQDVEVRRNLVEVLAKSHDRRVADTLAGFLTDADIDIRATAALALANFGDLRATDALFSLTRLPDPETEGTPDAEPQVSDDTMSDAIEALRWVATPAITSRLGDMLETHTYRRSAILAALGSTGDRNAERVIERELEGDDAPMAARSLAMLGLDSSFRKLLDMVERPDDVDMAAYSAADRSLTNEDLLRKRKGAIIAMGRFGRAEAIEALMKVVEDDNDDYELRGLAAASIGMCADATIMGQILGKVDDQSLSEHARRYYVQALWQRPHAELNSQLLDLMASQAAPEVRRAAALALGYAADPANDARLMSMLDDENARRNAAFAIVLGGGEEAVTKLVTMLGEDNDLEEVLQMTVMNQENDWFNIVMADMFENEAVWRRARAAAIMREGEGDNSYSYAWQKMVAVMRSGWEATGGITSAQIRDKLWEAITGDNEVHRELAAKIMLEIPERGLLLRARDEGGPAGEAARDVLDQRRR